MTFPPTRHSVVRATADADPDVRRDAFGRLVAAYWKPIYKYLRFRWSRSPEEAEDATQGFFAAAMEKQWLAGFDPDRARFRTFLRTCLDGYVMNEQRAAGRLKRGGGVREDSLDFVEAERELALQDRSAAADPEAFFEQEWVRALFGEAVAVLRERYGEPHALRFGLFERYDLATLDEDARPGYRELAAELGITVNDVTNHLAAARRDFRAIVLDLLRATTGSEEDAREELRALFRGR
jgi:RNA polymerase sigma factor (sigma-70 family)